MTLPEEKRNEITRELSDFERDYELLNAEKNALKKLLTQNDDYERFIHGTGIGKSCLSTVEEIYEKIGSLGTTTDRLLWSTHLFLKEASEVANNDEE